MGLVDGKPSKTDRAPNYTSKQTTYIPSLNIVTELLIIINSIRTRTCARARTYIILYVGTIILMMYEYIIRIMYEYKVE